MPSLNTTWSCKQEACSQPIDVPKYFFQNDILSLPDSPYFKYIQEKPKFLKGKLFTEEIEHQFGCKECDPLKKIAVAFHC